MTDQTRDQLLAAPIGAWIIVHSSHVIYQNIRGRDCMVSLAPTFASSRGNYLAAVESFNQVTFTVDAAHGFPRYYFNLGRAKAEIEAWLLARNQIPREGRFVRLSESLFDQVRSYFEDRAIADRHASLLLSSLIEAWATSSADIDRDLFDAIKAYVEPRTTCDQAIANLFAQLIKAELD